MPPSIKDAVRLSFLHEGEGLGLLDDHVGHEGVGGVLAVDGVEDELDALASKAILQGVDDAEVLQADVLGEDVEIGKGKLRKGKLVGGIAVGLDKALDVAQGLHVEILEHREEGHQRGWVDLGLIGGGDATIESVEGLHFEVAAERIGVERRLIELTGGNECLHAAAIVGERGAQTAELIVDELEHACQTAELAEVLLGDAHLALVAYIVLDGGPYVLKGRTHLELETVLIEFWHLAVVDEVLGDATDIVKGVVAKAGEIMELALVDGLFPVDVEDMLHDGSHLVDIIGVEGDDAHTEDIGDIFERLVLGALQFEFATKRLLGLDAMLDGVDIKAVLLQSPTQLVEYNLFHPLENGLPLLILLHQHLAMRIQCELVCHDR